MDKLISSFFNELEKIGRATLTWGMEHDPMTVSQGQPGMRPFEGVSRILPSDKPGYYKPPMPRIPKGV